MLLLLCLLAVFELVVSDTTSSILAGKEGVGKSYIAKLMGCSCTDEEKCTARSIDCKLKLIDSIGWYEDKIYSVAYEDNEFELSGLSYPLYNFFETLQDSGINDIVLFEVVDAENVQRGQISKDFFEFMSQVLGCRSTRIINKYRDDYNIKLLGNEIIVRENQVEAPVLLGPSCSVSIPKNWRDYLLTMDIDGLKFSFFSEKCTTLTARLNDMRETLEDVRKRPNEEDDTSNCLYEGDTGDRFCGSIPFLGMCMNWKPVLAWKTNLECIRQRDIANTERRIRNQSKKRLIAQLEDTIKDLESSICR